jgi:hypothetical protein
MRLPRQDSGRGGRAGSIFTACTLAFTDTKSVHLRQFGSGREYNIGLVGWNVGVF